MGEKEEIEKLANSFKKSGFAMSWLDAVTKAKDVLGLNNKRVITNPEIIKEVKSEKVNEIIQEVKEEIETKKIAEELPPTTSQIPVDKPETKDILGLNLDDPSFNIAETDMNLNELVKTDSEVFTNDKDILEKEKEAEKIEEGTEEAKVMTNEEIEKNKEDSSEDSFEEEG